MRAIIFAGWYIALPALVFSQPAAIASLSDPRTYLRKEVLEVEDDSSFIYCLNHSGGITTDTLNCLEYEWERIEVIEKGLLEDIERKGVKSRDQIEFERLLWDLRARRYCEKEQMKDTGTIGILVHEACWNDRMTSRIVHLSSGLER